MGFSVPVYHKVKKFKKRKDRSLFIFCQRPEKAVLGYGDINNIVHAWNSPQNNGENRNQIKNENHTNHIIVEIGFNTQKSPGDLLRLIVSQSPMKDQQLILNWETH